MEYVKVEKIIFKGKQNINWNEVEKYIKCYVDRKYINKEYGDEIVINTKSANEYAESNYTKRLRGALAKVKANIVQILPELIESATNRRWVENKNDKHNKNAINGWYRYNVFFSIPVKAEDDNIIRYNNYNATMIVRINDNGLFLYDIINIKKEARTPQESSD